MFQKHRCGGIHSNLQGQNLHFHNAEKNEKSNEKSQEEKTENDTWFMGLVVMVLLVIGRVELNLEPPREQVKTDQILRYVKTEDH